MQTNSLKILVIEDNEGDWFLIKEYLSELYLENYIIQSSRLKDALDQLALNQFDAILLDYSLPDSIGTKGIKKILSAAQGVPLIILTGYADRATAIYSLQLGAQDYLLKNEMTPALLLKSIAYSIERNKVKLQLAAEQHNREVEIADAVLTALENEKEQLSQELHDNIAQLMASSVMYLELAKKKGDKFIPYVDEAEKIIITATAELRTLSHVLAPPRLNHETLEDALTHLIQKTRTISGLDICSEWTPADLSSLPEKISLHIFRMVQEQLNNIIKHASASLINIKLVRNEDQLFLEIKDNGVGFDLSEKSEGLGLMNIKTRARLFNGTVAIITAPFKGCRIQVILTIKN